MIAFAVRWGLALVLATAAAMLWVAVAAPWWVTLPTLVAWLVFVGALTFAVMRFEMGEELPGEAESPDLDDEEQLS